MKEEERRNLRKDFQEISVSCHSMEDMKTAVENGATQIILGTIFETECKKGLRGKGLEFVRRNLQSLSGAGICDRRDQYGASAAGDGCRCGRRMYDVRFYENVVLKYAVRIGGFGALSGTLPLFGQNKRA